MAKRAKSVIAGASSVLMQFADATAVHQKRVAQPRPIKLGLRIGRIIAIAYTVQDGDSRIHRFKKGAAPDLIAAADGKQLAIIGGNFRFTDRGIVDK